MTTGDERRFDWGSGWAAAGGLLATLILLGMVFLVAMSNRAREEALTSERHAYDVNLLTRGVDATLVRAEAALGTFVLDEDAKTTGNIYYSQWRLGGEQIFQLDRLVARDPKQSKRVDQLETLYNAAASSSQPPRGPFQPSAERSRSIFIIRRRSRPLALRSRRNSTKSPNPNAPRCRCGFRRPSYSPPRPTA